MTEPRVPQVGDTMVVMGRYGDPHYCVTITVISPSGRKIITSDSAPWVWCGDHGERWGMDERYCGPRLRFEEPHDREMIRIAGLRRQIAHWSQHHLHSAPLACLDAVAAAIRGGGGRAVEPIPPAVGQVWADWSNRSQGKRTLRVEQIDPPWAATRMVLCCVLTGVDGEPIAQTRMIRMRSERLRPAGKGGYCLVEDAP